jgi:hypothetical protein
VGHITRVGAAQDLAELDIDLAAITQADGCKSTRMPLQYAEKINAARSGMARAAAASGRDGCAGLRTLFYPLEAFPGECGAYSQEMVILVYRCSLNTNLV